MSREMQLIKEETAPTAEDDTDTIQPDSHQDDGTTYEEQPSSMVSSEVESEGSILSEHGANQALERYTPIPDVVPNEQPKLREQGDWRCSKFSLASARGSMLPWSAHKERAVFQMQTPDSELRPGELVMRMLFAEFTVQAERKMETVMAEPPEKLLSLSLKRGEDPQLDQVLCAFGTVAEHCLPSLLRALFGWLDRQMQDSLQLSEHAKKPQDQKNKSIIYIVSVSGMGAEPVERSADEIMAERRDLAVEFLFCLALIEVLKQLTFHPGHEDLVQHIENLAFKRFNYKEGLQSNPNAPNVHIIADLYAEVIGVLAQSRFMSVRKRFTSELKELKSREPTPHTTQSIISLLMGMKFFRVKMVPIEEFEASFQFLQECAQYFLEVKDKDIKHALAGLFVEILVPVAATVKNEVNVPCLKNFVDMLYSQTLDASTKSKHRLALFPLVTCLLCVSQKPFFLANWHYFLAMCLSHLKNRDPKMCRVALESLYRLLWVYMIRIKCESNSATQSRLQSIVNSLFPKGSKGVVPRDTPLNIFVKIIQFIAQERLDFAMREIVFDLLMVGRPIKIILTPERMSIGLRAFLVVADSLQQKEGEPPMPRTSGTLPSGNTLRVKKTFLNKMLTEEAAKSIGMIAYFPFVRKVLADILRALDAQVGRPLMMNNMQNITKEQEINTGDRKPRIDLFRTCVAAIPRLIPDGMSGTELVDMLSRLTVHIDEELRGLAYQSLQTLLVDFPEWRPDVLHGFTHFLAKDVQDTTPKLVENGLRMMVQLLTLWKSNLQSAVSTNAAPVPQPSAKQEPLTNIIRGIEALGLVMLCQCRPYTRRTATHIMRECKHLLERLGLDKEEPSLMDGTDQFLTQIAEQMLHLLPPPEKQAILAAGQIDLCWLTDRTHPVWSPGLAQDEETAKNSTSSNSCQQGGDPWQMILFSLMEKPRVPAKCPTAIHLAWPILYSRINALYAIIDPTPVNDNRASILRSTAPAKKPEKERDMHIYDWKHYLTMAYLVVPQVPSPIIRCASPDLSLSQETAAATGAVGCDSLLSVATTAAAESSSTPIGSLESISGRFTLPISYGRRDKQHKRTSSSPDSLSGEKASAESKSWLGSNAASPAQLHKLTVPLIKCEVQEVRDAVIFALGHINPDAIKDVMEELILLIREAIDRKQENMRRRRRRDALRLHLARVLLLIAQKKTFSQSSFSLENGSFHPHIVEYLDGARQYLEAETEKDSPAIRELRLIFADFVTKLVKSFPVESYQRLMKKELRGTLFNVFSCWCGTFAKLLQGLVAAQSSLLENDDQLNYASLQAMSAIVCCGPCFAPSALAEEGALYPWLNGMLSSNNEKVYKLGRETVVLLLECNPEIGPLLDWTIDKCFTGNQCVADGCFLALATIFSAREYPCDHYTAVINVTLMCTGCPRSPVNETALQLLQVLDRRFFRNIGPVYEEDGALVEARSRGYLDALLCAAYSRSQMYLSRQLSQLHPELTMPMFSEITFRMQTARNEVRQLLLQYLLPWLVNIELVDPNVPPPNQISYVQYYNTDGGRGRREGLGSAEATEMVLNNLFYITAKFSDNHPKEVEELWATLCACWPNNLKVIIRYLIIISGMAPNDLLPCAKRVVLYLARSRPERLLDEMMNELQLVETLNNIERTETPPFYRLTNTRKASTHSDNATGSSGNQDISGRPTDTMQVEKGTIHTKRHSGEDPAKSCGIKSNNDAPGTPWVEKRSSMPPAQPRPATPPATQQMHNSPAAISCNTLTDSDCVCFMPQGGDCDDAGFHTNETSVTQIEAPLQPRPLPMPEYGGYFAPLTEYLPDGSQPISIFHRCNVAVMLLCDVVLDGIEIDWAIHVPLMLHIVFLGMDHNKWIVHQHCRRLLLNLLIAVAAHNDHLTVSKLLLNASTARMGLGLPHQTLSVVPHSFTEPDPVFDSYLQNKDHIHRAVPQIANSGAIAAGEPQPAPEVENMPDIPSVVVETIEENETVDKQEAEVGVTATNREQGVVEMPVPGADMSVSDVIKSLIHFLAERPDHTPLWNYEDITAKVWTVRSCQQLATLLQHVLRIFNTSLPHALISERWAQTALQLGLSCPSRHYAGRSLQVFRLIGVSMSGRMVSDILSRLVETVAEQGEDMQGYVTELLLTLESAVDSLESNFRPLDYMRDIFKSTPNLNNKENVAVTPIGAQHAAGKRSPGGCGGCITNHTRSTSYSVSYCTRKVNGTSAPPSESKAHDRTRPCPEAGKGGCNNSLCRSRSAQSLRMLGDSATQDDKLTILATLFWLAVSLLESDYEHEFLLGVRLLSRVLKRLPLDRPDARDRVDRLQSQLRWHNYPGVYALLLKGCTHPSTYEPVISVLGELTPLLELCVLDPGQSLAFPMTVLALLPYMLLHFEDANETCVRAAYHIATVTAEKSKKLENLGTVMNLYSRRTFSKESVQWTKCVVKYLWDTYSHLSLQMLAFLVEVLEKGPPSLQLPILSILHCMLVYVDLNAPSSQPIIADLLRVVAKFIDGGGNYKEAMKVLKLVVTRCSTLVVPPHWESHIIDIELQAKKELPGRTMDFTFDLSQTPVIGRKYVGKTASSTTSAITPERGSTISGVSTMSTPILQEEDSSNNSSCMGSVVANLNQGGLSDMPRPNMNGQAQTCLSPRMPFEQNNQMSGWKKPWMSQGRVRECLVNLLTTCGQRVGLPKSPSVIFSQSSELLERESSMASSLEEMSIGHCGNDLSGGSRGHDNGGPTDHFGVFKDFDFLEYESESIEGESSDNFNWGVRRRPLSEERNASSTTTTPGIIPSTSSACEKSPPTIGLHRSQPLNAASKLHVIKRVTHEDSSDDEVGSESPAEEIGNLGTVVGSNSIGALILDPALEIIPRERTHSSSSQSTADGDVTPVPASAGRASTPRPTDPWRSGLKFMLRQTSPTTIQFVHKLHTVLKELILKTVTMCIDGVLLSTSFVPLRAAHELSVTVDTLGADEMALLFVGQNICELTRMQHAFRLAALQVNEHLDTFFDRREAAVEVLDLAPRCNGEELERCLYKQIFQLVLLLETNNKMLTNAYLTALAAGAQDMSTSLRCVRNALVACRAEESSTDGSDSFSLRGDDNTITTCTDQDILELLLDSKWSLALTAVRERTVENILERGEIPEDDITTLVHIYAKHLIVQNPDMVAITRPVNELSQNLHKLMDNLYKMSIMLQCSDNN